MALKAPFATPGAVRQGWYALARSRRVRSGRVTTVQVGAARLVLHRDANGRVHATGDRCGHLGADLSLAKVTPRGLECAFHGWCWGEEGRCTSAPGNKVLPSRSIPSYHTEERHGLVWGWLADGPPAPLPEPPAHLPIRIALREQRVGGHTDVVFSNGFDLGHFGPSHAISARTVANHAEPPWRFSHHLEGTLPRRLVFRAAGIGGKPLEAVATQIGGGIVHVHMRQPVEYLIAFAMRPEADGAARTATQLFLRRRRDLPAALAFLWTAVLDDLRLMETMRWNGALAESDAALARYVRFMESLPLWTPAPSDPLPIRQEPRPKETEA